MNIPPASLNYSYDDGSSWSAMANSATNNLFGVWVAPPPMSLQYEKSELGIIAGADQHQLPTVFGKRIFRVPANEPRYQLLS